jgi:predicted nicotinamide N-methyase
MTDATPSLPETPADALGPPIRDVVTIEDRTFRIDRPENADHLLDHPAVRAAFAADEYLPHWVELWPAAKMLAKAVMREPWPEPRPEALEIGCGLGLPGIAALACGLRVTFTDYDATALRYAAANAKLNGFRDFAVLTMDWRRPPEGLRVPVLLGSDLIYELRSVEPVVSLIKRLLAPGGVCLLTDQDRAPSAAFREGLVRGGLTFVTQFARAGSPGVPRTKGTLYRIRHAE